MQLESLGILLCLGIEVDEADDAPLAIRCQLRQRLGKPGKMSLAGIILIYQNGIIPPNHSLPAQPGGQFLYGLDNVFLGTKIRLNILAIGSDGDLHIVAVIIKL